MSKPLHTWKIAVTIPLSGLNATPSIPASVGVNQAIQNPHIPLGNHPYISMGNNDYLSIEVLMRHAIGANHSTHVR